MKFAITSQIIELRLIYEAKLQETLPTPTIDPRDSDKVKSVIYLNRILEHCNNDVQQAADMLYNIMLWRTDNIDDALEFNLDLNILREGVFFPRGRDLHNCLLLIMNYEAYVRNQNYFEEVKNVFIYWLERLEKEEDGKKVTLFFDMDGSINNMNLNIITYMIGILHNYYPNFINHIIFFQLSQNLHEYVINILEMLPASAKVKCKIVNKHHLKMFVAPDQALVSWGGKDNYKFEFIAEIHPNILYNDNEDDNYCHDNMLRLQPSHKLFFEYVGKKIFAQLSLTNIDEGIVAFKIRATDAIKYKICPNYGILLKYNTKNIEIKLRAGFNLDSITNDRVSISSVRVLNFNEAPTKMSHIWDSTESNINQYRLICAVKEQTAIVTKIAPNAMEEITTSMTRRYNLIYYYFYLVNRYLYAVMVFVTILFSMNVVMLRKIFNSN